MDILPIAGLWLDVSVWDEVAARLKARGHRASWRRRLRSPERTDHAHHGRSGNAVHDPAARRVHVGGVR
jgi:hypothetical protein